MSKGTLNSPIHEDLLDESGSDSEGTVEWSDESGSESESMVEWFEDSEDDLEEETKPEQFQLIEQMRMAHNKWKSQQEDPPKRKTPRFYPGNSKRTQQRNKKEAKKNERINGGTIYDLLLRTVHHNFCYAQGQRLTSFRQQGHLQPIEA